MPTFVDSNLLLRGFAPMDKNGTKATAIIEGCSFAFMEGFLNT